MLGFCNSLSEVPGSAAPGWLRKSAQWVPGSAAAIWGSHLIQAVGAAALLLLWCGARSRARGREGGIAGDTGARCRKLCPSCRVEIAK